MLPVKVGDVRESVKPISIVVSNEWDAHDSALLYELSFAPCGAYPRNAKALFCAGK
jgi:hypothetical protein